MVKRRRAPRVLHQDTTSVVPELVVASGQSHVDWAYLNGLLDRQSVLLRVAVAADIGNALGLFVGADRMRRRRARSVWVVTFAHRLVVGQPVVGPHVLATVAAVVPRHWRQRAVDELLWRHDRHRAAIDDPLGLDDFCCREGPAGATGTLVLDGRDGAQESPVDRVRARRGEITSVVEWALKVVHVLETEELIVFLCGPVRHAVDASPEGEVLRVDLINNGNLLGKDISAHLEFLSSVVELLELTDVLHEKEVILREQGSL